MEKEMTTKGQTDQFRMCLCPHQLCLESIVNGNLSRSLNSYSPQAWSPFPLVRLCSAFVHPGSPCYPSTCPALCPPSACPAVRLLAQLSALKPLLSLPKPCICPILFILRIFASSLCIVSIWLVLIRPSGYVLRCKRSSAFLIRFFSTSTSTSHLWKPFSLFDFPTHFLRIILTTNNTCPAINFSYDGSS